MVVSEIVFWLVPLLAMIINLFIFMTFLAAKKNKIIYSFILLLIAFTAWTAGSFFMRLSVYPGVLFWYEVSITGIFAVPFCYYQFMYDYTNQKGKFLKSIILILSIAMIILNLLDVFIKPSIDSNVAGSQLLNYVVKWPIVFLLIFFFIVIFLIIRMVYQSIKKNSISGRLFSPLALGISVMFVGVMIQILPGFGAYPSDTLACMFNSGCIYYALYKRRMISLTQVTSKSPIYLIAAIITIGILGAVYKGLNNFYNLNFEAYLQYKTIVFSVIFSIVTVLTYQIMSKLASNLFIKGRAAKEAELKRFSLAVNQTLDIKEVEGLFMNFITDNIPGAIAYYCAMDENSSVYHIQSATHGVSAKDFVIPQDHPVISWFTKNKDGINYKDFNRTGAYKAMWEKEKLELIALNIDFLLPIVCDDALVGIVLFANGNRKNSFKNSEIDFLESVAAVFSISIRNARMYVEMRKEARIDALTGLYNRKHFTETAQNELAQCSKDSYVLALLDLDDFHLYNELYGTKDGDDMLKTFAGLITSVMPANGTVARYSGKEFIVSMPHCDIPAALSYVERVRGMLAGILQNEPEKTKKFLTFSAGICAYPISSTSLTELITNVSMAVFTAKNNGKNQIIVYGGSVYKESSKSEFNAGAMQKKDIGESYASTIFALTAAINAKDHYTFAHSTNVSEYAALLAQHVGLDSEHVEIIRQAGLLHDIGKIGISENILSKNSRLSDDEYEVMKSHVESAIAIIRYLPSLDYVIPVAIGHHEHWDGKGYPRSLRGEEIPIGARCLCIVDSFDAMVSRRPYREPMPVEDALREIERNLGRQFDPKIGALFVKLVRDGTIEVRTLGTE